MATIQSVGETGLSELLSEAQQHVRDDPSNARHRVYLFQLLSVTGDWDRAVGMNTPGQSGDIRDPHYRDLFEDWANDRFFPVVYSRGRVEAATDRVYQLRPVR